MPSPSKPGSAKLESNRILRPERWPVPQGYADGMVASGQIVVTGGVVGWDGQRRFPRSFVEQTRLALENIVAIIAVGKARPEHIVRLTWYVVDMDQYLSSRKLLGRVYRENMGSHYPAMAVVQVVRLVEPEALVEIEATAVVPG
jgi:enamine deaminase RidA (YjgF/YER057c/UK114 family)